MTRAEFDAITEGLSRGLLESLPKGIVFSLTFADPADLHERTVSNAPMKDVPKMLRAIADSIEDADVRPKIIVAES